ncbi:MAG: pseudouridine synthase [Zoogloeaceae bacterium]|nr:pseudouridine synthase [Zoogloeaceae bacterium]
MRNKKTPFRPPAPAPGNRRRLRGRNAPESRRGSPLAEVPAERLQKVLAQAGIGSRRKVEDWITAGKVEVNGKPATLGQRVAAGDRVKVGGKLVGLRPTLGRLPRVLLYHKPEGEIVSRDDPQGRPNVFTALPRLRGERWVAVGRLDINTSGLILFTTSGALANRLMHPGTGLLREYAARVLGELTPETCRQLLSGVQLEDGPAQFASIADAGGQGANHWYRIRLAEGRNREVRRMFEAVGHKVSRLIRVRYGPLYLPPRLRRGQALELAAPEVKALLRTLAQGEQETGKPAGDDHEGSPE